MLPGADELKQFAQRIYEQVEGYLTLYPRRAADEIRRALHGCRTFVEQWHAVAETIKAVLRADAVTLYARPWRELENLYLIATTAPLMRKDGRSLASIGPEHRPAMSLIPVPHKIGDGISYAGTLAGRPGDVLHRNSLRHSMKRLEAEGFPVHPSDDYRATLPRTASADPRFLGYSLPNRKHRDWPSNAVALVVRSADRAPFKAWDAAALVAMLHAAAPMFRAWRDWSAPRLPEATGVIYQVYEDVQRLFDIVTSSVDRDRDSVSRRNRYQLHKSLPGYKQEIFYSLLARRLSRGDTMPHRLHDPIPRSESLAALTREIAADAHERAHNELDGYRHVLQATVLMEAQDRDRSVMHPIAYYHEYRNAIPRTGDPEDPRQLRIPGLGEDWRRFLDEGNVRVFRGGSDGEGPVSAGVRVPFLAWIGRHAARGVDLGPAFHRTGTHGGVPR